MPVESLQPSPYYIEEAKVSEGFKSRAYDDKNPNKVLEVGDTVEGTLTIAHGDTGPHVFIGMTVTKEEAHEMLVKRLDGFHLDLCALVKVPLNQNEYNAILDMFYQYGRTKLEGTEFIRTLNSGDYASFPFQFLRWYKTDGQEKGQMKRCVKRFCMFKGLPWQDSQNHITDALMGVVIGKILPLKGLEKDILEVAVRQASNEKRVLKEIQEPPPKPPPVASEPDPPKEAGFSLPEEKPKEAETVTIPEVSTPIVPEQKQPSAYTRRLEEIDYGVDPNAGAKPMVEAGRYRYQRNADIGVFLVNTGALLGLGPIYMHFTQFMAANPESVEMAFNIFTNQLVPFMSDVAWPAAQTAGGWVWTKFSLNKVEHSKKEASQVMY